jgi:hypothetical protein
MKRLKTCLVDGLVTCWFSVVLPPLIYAAVGDGGVSVIALASWTLTK